MEDNRQMETYHCRLTPILKRKLLTQAAIERRTANKIVADAIMIYLRLTPAERKEIKKRDGRAADKITLT